MTTPVTHSKKIDMTVPVTQLTTDDRISMRFFLPQKYSKQNAPIPINERISIIDRPIGYFAVISHSGFSSDYNFEKHYTESKNALNKDGLVLRAHQLKLVIIFLKLPFLRRNEVMYLLKLN